MKTISSSSPTSPRARFSIRRRLCSDDFFLKFYHRRVANGGVIDVLQSLRNIERGLQAADASNSSPTILAPPLSTKRLLDQPADVLWGRPKPIANPLYSD